MLIIRSRFVRLDALSLGEIYDAIGVYVLWGPRSKVRPKYIGEGEVLKRFVEHMKWLHRPFGGVAAVFGYRGERGEGPAKRAAQAVEKSLLYIAAETNRFPTRNKNEGHYGGLWRLLRKTDATIRLHFEGHDPLLPPERARMRKKKTVTFRKLEDGDWAPERLPWKTH